MLKLASTLFRATGALGSEASCSYAVAVAQQQRRMAGSLGALRLSSDAPAQLNGSSSSQLSRSSVAAPGAAGSALASCLSLVRTVFGAAPKKVNQQVHTHDKYQAVHPQPTYDWMVGRFIKDRNGVIWHKQANSSHRRHGKSSSQLTRLKRLKPLAPAYAKKLLKLGFDRKFWVDPDPRMVPGFHRGPFRPLPRHDATPDLRDKLGDPALLPH